MICLVVFCANNFGNYNGNISILNGREGIKLQFSDFCKTSKHLKGLTYGSFLMYSSHGKPDDYFDQHKGKIKASHTVHKLERESNFC